MRKKDRSFFMSKSINLSYKTAESVSPKHPDKMCDQISDAILDEYLTVDKESRVAVECVGGHGKIFIVGEVTSSAEVEIEPIVSRLVGDIELETRIVRQSPEIAKGVDSGGAGDQGIMVGYACNETAAYLPLETVLSRELNQYLYNIWPYDGKTQITINNDLVESVVASFQNSKKNELYDAVTGWLRSYKLKISKNISIHCNPAGDWTIGGFEADTGLTGRKLVVDNYGPNVAIGGGCSSGKDASKVDRSAAYMARKIALDYLKSRRAKEVYCYLAYAIGFEQPLQAVVKVDGKEIDVIGYDLTPAGIIKYLNLKQPQYEATARYGHFGHPEFSWEK
jgi:S-adenosylmethionine synthetase